MTDRRSQHPALVHSFVLFEEGKDERQIEQMLRAAMRNGGPITISCKTRAIRRRVQRVADRIGLSIA
jgi:hypothetical protein